MKKITLTITSPRQVKAIVDRFESCPDVNVNTVTDVRLKVDTDRARAMRDDGMTLKQIADVFGVSVRAISNHVDARDVVPLPAFWPGYVEGHRYTLASLGDDGLEWIRQALEAGCSQRQIAAALGVGQGAIANWKRRGKLHVV
ncbi:hypothetical protein ACWPLX_000907 [Escherichia coli]